MFDFSTRKKKARLVKKVNALLFLCFIGTIMCVVGHMDYQDEEIKYYLMKNLEILENKGGTL